MPLLEDVFDEIAAIRSYQDRVRSADANARLYSPRQVQNMAMAARMWPDLSPGALLALGKGGYRPDHPLVQQLGELSARLQLRDHPYGAAYGDSSVTPAMRRGQAEARREANRAQALQTIGPNRLDLAIDAASGVDKEDLVRSRAQLGLRDFQSPDIATRASARGIIDAEGTLRLPVERKFDRVKGEYTFDSPTDEDTYNLFFQVAGAVAESQGSDEPIPFLQADGTTGIFYPKTGQVGTTESGEVGIELPGPIDEMFNAARGNTLDWLRTARVPTLPGAPQGQLPGQPATAGVGTSPQELIQRGFMAADLPVQETQGLVRNLYAAAHGEPVDWWETQSDIGVQLTTGFDDPGSGFFVDPESEVAQERRRREAERGQIGGHNVTLGRWVADGLTPFDPNTRPAMIVSGLVDFGVQLADPSAFAAGRVGAAQEARRLFGPAAAQADEAAGVVHGLREMVRPESWQHWLDSETGIRALDGFAEERDAYTIWRGSRRKMPLSVARELADTRDAAAARAVLEPHLGRDIREVATVTPGRGGRPISVMPARGKIDAHNQDLVAFEVEATLRNAHASDDVIAQAIDRVARADSPIKLNAAIRRAIDEDLIGALQSKGVVDEGVLSQLTRLNAGAHEEASNTFVEAVTHQGPTDNPLLLGGETITYPGAHLIVEHAPRYIQMPDARPIRALTSEFPHIFGRNVFVNAKGEARLPTSVLEHFQNRLWKPTQLMRMAWTVRVIGEEQVRMAAAGLASMFKHPLSYIALRTGRKGGTGVEGTLLNEADEFKAAMAQSHGGWVDHAMPLSGKKTTFTKGLVHERERFNESWGSELIRLSSDPVAQKVANAESMDEAYEWFTRGGGNKFRSDLAAAHPGRFDDIDAARAYIDTVQRRIDYATGGNGDLLDAVRTGRFDGEDMLTGTTQQADLASKLDGFHDDFAPLRVIGEESIPSGAGSRWDSAVDRMFGLLMTRRTNNLSRSPTFKQAYWKEAERLIGFSDETTKAAIIAQARDAGIGSRAVRRMERARATGEATLKEVDLWAKGHALDTTKGLLYDMTRRGRFFDATRLVFPFGEAWNEVIHEWFGLRTGLASPLTGRGLRNIRRFQQTVQGARGEDFGEVMGAPNGEGFFWKNEFDEEVFVYPGSSLLTDKLLGVPIPLTGRVQGLSMFGTIVPGLGPAVQIPVGWFLQNKPGPQWAKEILGDIEGLEIPHLGTVREQLIPFGATGAEDQADIANVLNFVPPWMRTGFDWAFAGDGNQQQWNNSVMSMAAYLRSTGQYGNSRADQVQLMEDASHKARWFYFIKALAQSSSPSSPAPEWQVLSKDDKLLRIRALAEEYRDLQTEDYASADQTFLERYGSEVLEAVQPKTAGVEYAVPVTREGAQWVIENPGVKSALPHTYGFFAPQGGEFDYSLYSAQFERGERVQLDPETWIRLMNATKANVILEDAKSQVGEDIDTDEGRAYMKDVRLWLDENYYGWRDMSGLPQRPSTADMVAELKIALDNEAIRKTDAGQGLAAYMEGRSQVIADLGDDALRSDGTLSRSQAMADARTYLKDLAAWAINEHPGFETLWNIVLSREVDVDE